MRLAVLIVAYALVDLYANAHGLTMDFGPMWQFAMLLCTAQDIRSMLA